MCQYIGAGSSYIARAYYGYFTHIFFMNFEWVNARMSESFSQCINGKNIAIFTHSKFNIHSLLKKRSKVEKKLLNNANCRKW